MAGQARETEFTEYVATRSGWLRKVAYLLCGDWHRADDLVQESVTRLYINWPRAGRMENLDGYARRVLVNIFLAEQRSSWWRRTTRSGTDRELDAAAVGPDLDASLDLRQALATLPPRQRATVVLRYYCDLTVDQAAEAMGCSSGNVKSQTSRGLATLRHTLAALPVATERTP
ncbi:MULTISPECIES: SigE family RNA polymerase sigma factor [unclassified Kitasatospora]|uniref:SigE family RNA polymerase sigma factor n=1 Tax=unclassified Kitasatospora TaxID=2633591 RepID=UPI0038136472